MSTFSGINTAYTGLVAARLGLDVVGQNISNASTEGYTRQRVSTSSIGPVANTGLLDSGLKPGQGVFVDGIARLGNATLDARVRGTAANAGYWTVRAQAYDAVEETLREPGANGISATLDDFWAAWQSMGNRAGEGSAASALLEQANTLAAKIAGGYRELDGQWSALRGNVDSIATDVNGIASQVATLNAAIRSALTSGSSANELIDQRNVLTERLAALAGGVVRDKGDGTVDVTIGGNAIVLGTTSRAVKLVGAATMADLATQPPVQLVWANSPAEPIALDGGTLAGLVSVLAPANASGTGGTIAQAAQAYDELATRLAAKVNGVHATGYAPDGTTGHAFFGFAAGMPAALGLRVVPTGIDGIAAAASPGSLSGGGNADAIAQLALEPDSPDSLWASFVTRTGVASRSELQQSQLADLASQQAVSRQHSEASVDLDEENLNLIMFQHAYQGAARVMTAMDEMLDTLINRMGLVGR